MDNVPLKNVRHEKFAQLVAAGKTQAEAYREVYPGSRAWQDASVHQRASKLCAKVLPRVQALQRAAADSAVCTAREIQERLSRQFRALDEAGDVDGLVKVGALLAKVTGAEGATRVEVRDGGVTADYRPPPAVARLGDEELRGLLLDEP